MGAASPAPLSQSLDRLACQQPRKLDAGYGGHVADDRADHVAFADRADADRGQPSGSLPRPSRRGHGGHLRPPPPVDLLAGLDAGHGSGVERADHVRSPLAGRPAGAHLPAEYRRRDEQSGMAGDRPGTCAALRVGGRDRAQQYLFQSGARPGACAGGLGVGAFASPRVGAAVVFLLNSASFLAVIFVLYGWKRTPLYKSALPAERIFGSMRSGVRYVRHSPALRAILLRAFLFTGFASAVWALLAVVARQDLHAGAMAYGILNGCLGAGAVIGASLLPRLRRRLPAEWMLAGAGAIFTGTLATLALTRSLPLIVFWLVAAGCAWTTTTSTLNIAVQLSVPDWVQARTLGIYQMVFAGGMSGGSALWGLIAERSSSQTALLAAAAGMV